MVPTSMLAFLAPLAAVITSDSTISTITSAITSIVTAAVSWTTSWANEIVSTPLLLFFIVFGAVGFGIGAIMRIVRR